MALSKNFKYDLKKQHKFIFKISVIISLLLLISAFRFSPFEIQSKKEKITIKNEPTRIKNPPPPTGIKPPPPPMPLIPITVPNNTFPDVENIPFLNLEPDDELKIKERPRIKDNNTVDNYVFIPIQAAPKPIGGIKSVYRKITYPEIARKAGIEGRVIAEVYLNENGNVDKVLIIKGLEGGFNDEVINALLNSKFTPAKQRSRNIKVKIVIPFVFKLN